MSAGPLSASGGEAVRGAEGASQARALPRQFLGMIATVVFWPCLVHVGWSLSEAEVRRVVEEAAETIAARYGR